MKQCFLSAFTLLLSFCSFSQNPNSNINALTETYTKTPGVTDFIKYGNISNTSFTGELSTNVPLINTPIPGNTPLGLNLSYVGSGFRPSKRNGLVGQNWFLSGIGVITREVNGMPDEQKGHPNDNGSGPNLTNGFFVGVQNKIHNSHNVYDEGYGTSYTNLNYERYLFGSFGTSNSYESDPDVFSFNFNGLSGKFFIKHDGTVHVISNSPVKLTVDLTEFTLQDDFHVGCTPNTPSRIIIKDDKGNKYSFGGATKNLEYSLNLPNNEDYQSDRRPIINAWYLSKIEYYNGYTIDFNYRDDSGLGNAFEDQKTIKKDNFYTNYINNVDNIKDFILVSENFSEQRTIIEVTGSLPGTGSLSGWTDNTLNVSLQKIAILESISGDDFNIKFNYSRQNHKFNTRNSSSDLPINKTYFSTNSDGFIDLKLDNISYTTKNSQSIKNYKFNYEYFGGAHSRMFLSSLSENGEKYKFEYYPTGNLPKPITKGVDHWGFWNGGNDNSNKLIPILHLDSNGSQTITGVSRNPSFTHALKGQLKKMYYPTGGYSEFEYEPHTYTKRLEARYPHFIPQLYAENGITGGVRIKKVNDYEGGITQNRKVYDYNSSGVLLKWPRYALSYTYAMNKLGYIRSNPIGRNLMESTIITYAKVKEGTYGNGYTITKFNDFESNPDKGTLSDILSDTGDINTNSFYKWRAATPSANNNTTPEGLGKNYFAYLLNDLSIERGKTSWVKIYNQANELKKEFIYEYNENPARFDEFTTKIHLTGLFNQFNKMYQYSNFLTKETSKEYLNSGIISNIKEYTYDYTKNKIIKTRTTTSDNEILDKDFTFIDVPTKHLTLLNKTKVLKNNVLINEYKIKYGNTTTASTAFKFFPKEITSSKKILTNSLNSTIKQIHKSDYRGNPIEFSTKNGIHICYIWGYNNLLPIAKIENSNYSDIESFVSNLQNLSNLDTSNSIDYSGPEGLLRQALDDLRNEPSLSKSFITTFTHDPLIGMTSMTNPRGETTYYEYDSRERLILIRDSDGNKLRANEYNYQMQN